MSKSKKAIAIQEDTLPIINYEMTIHCLVCNYKLSRGGLDAPSNLTKTEVWTLSLHNPRCKIPQQCECLSSVSSGVSTTDTSHTTHYLISAVE